jgi:hypothetical protein
MAAAAPIRATRKNSDFSDVCGHPRGIGAAARSNLNAKMTAPRAENLPKRNRQRAKFHAADPSQRRRP